MRQPERRYKFRILRGTHTIGGQTWEEKDKQGNTVSRQIPLEVYRGLNKDVFRSATDLSKHNSMDGRFPKFERLPDDYDIEGNTSRVEDELEDLEMSDLLKLAKDEEITHGRVRRDELISLIRKAREAAPA